jgi:hypothetical protein
MALMAVPIAGLAEEEPWVAMSGAEIAQALTEQTLKYATATQTFYASGKTLYDSGRPSWGYWRVEGDQYCSQWPPNDLWACYGLEQQGVKVRFVGQRDDITEGSFVNAE